MPKWGGGIDVNTFIPFFVLKYIYIQHLERFSLKIVMHAVIDIQAVLPC
jgi:hypothetical protein